MTRQIDAEKTILEKHANGVGISKMAEALGVNSGHISHVVSQRRKPGPTLVKAMLKNGWLPKPEPYPYFKIRKDDPEVAAKQLIDNMTMRYCRQLARCLDEEVDVKLRKVGRRFLVRKIARERKERRGQ